MALPRITVLISGRGSNLRALLEAMAAGTLGGAVTMVISNRADALGLELARAHGVPVAVVDHRAHASREDFDLALAAVVDASQPDLVVLAGFMRVLTDTFVQRYAGRLLNIHPSLLPAFAGLHSHQRAIEAGCKLAGATVHFVTPTLDHGPIVAQAVVPVLPGDTPATLSERVLAVEHVLYPLAVRWFVEDQLMVDGGVVQQRRGEAQLLLGDG